MNSLRRRRMLYERAFADGRRSAKEDITISAVCNGEYILLRWPLSMCLLDSKITLPGGLNLYIQDESK